MGGTSGPQRPEPGRSGEAVADDLTVCGADVELAAADRGAAADCRAAGAGGPTEPSPPNRQGVANQALAALGMPGAGFGHPRAITPAGQNFGHPRSPLPETRIRSRSSENGGRALLSTRAPGAASLGPPTTLSREGDGDALIAAAGRHVLVAYQRNDRLELKIVR